MLRRIVLGITLLLAAAGLWLVNRHVWVPGVQLLIVAAAVFLGIVFESWRYRQGPAPSEARWQRTGEKFADPVNGEETEVQYDPVSGVRRYVRR